MNKIKINAFSEEIELEIKKTRYASNNSLALEAYEVESGESYSTLSVNLPGQEYLLEEKEFFFDTNHDYFGIKEALILRGMILMVNKIGTSSFCTYPVCKLMIDLPEDI